MRRKFAAALVAALLVLPLTTGAAGAALPKGPVSQVQDGQLQPVGATDLPAALKEPVNRANLRAEKPVQGTGAKAQARKAGDRNADKVADRLEEALQRAPRSETLDVVIVTRGEPAANAALVQTMREVDVKQVFSRAITGFTAKVKPEQVALLKALPEVTRIELNERVQVHLDSATVWSGGSHARSDFLLQGNRDGNPVAVTTDDVVIAVIDTGIDSNHLDLQGKVIGWQDMVNGLPEPYDDNGHGTHVSGIAAGAGRANPALKGMAPGAALVGVKVLTGDGWGTYEWVIGGIEWVIENKDRYNIRVLNMSLGTAECSDGLDPLSQAVNAAVEAGIVAVVSAGNSGPDTCTTGAPAAAERAITVGAMRDVGEGGWTLAPWSSRGPTADGRKKPDVVAPGSRITAPMAGTRDRYVIMSGTSMASPMVAGTVALMLEAGNSLSPSEVKQALADTAQDWGPRGRDSEYGWGRLNAYRAVQRSLGLRGFGPRQPTHGIGTENLVEFESVFYRLPVTNDNLPIALTLIMSDWTNTYIDADLYLYDPTGNLVAYSTGMDRQETIQYRPDRTGDYYVEVASYEGAGPYILDVSWK